jgi:hypothetical protein
MKKWNIKAGIEETNGSPEKITEMLLQDRGIMSKADIKHFFTRNSQLILPPKMYI